MIYFKTAANVVVTIQIIISIDVCGISVNYKMDKQDKFDENILVLLSILRMVFHF